MSKSSTNASALRLELPFKEPQNLDEVESNISYLEGELASEKPSSAFVWVVFIILPIIFTVLRFRGIVLFPHWIYILMWLGMVSGGYMFVGSGNSKSETKLYHQELKHLRAMRKRFLVGNNASKNTRQPQQPTAAKLSSPKPFINKDMMSDLLDSPAEDGLKKLVENDLKAFEHRYESLQSSRNWNMGFIYLLGGVGFVFMAIGLLTAFNNPVSFVPIYLTVFVGIFTEAIAAGLFFWYHKKTTKELENYQNGLTKMQKILLYFKLSQAADNELDKKMMMQRMIDYVIEDDFFDKY